MRPASTLLTELGIPHEVRILSAHRTPRDLLDNGAAAAERGLRVLIGAAAAHLPGMLAAVTCPVEAHQAATADASRATDTDLRNGATPC